MLARREARTVPGHDRGAPVVRGERRLQGGPEHGVNPALCLLLVDVWDQISETMEHTSNQFLERVNAIIEQNLHNESFSTADLARAVFLCRMQLHRRIKRETNLSAARYINQVLAGRLILANVLRLAMGYARWFLEKLAPE